MTSSSTHQRIGYLYFMIDYVLYLYCEYTSYVMYSSLVRIEANFIIKNIQNVNETCNLYI